MCGGVHRPCVIAFEKKRDQIVSILETVKCRRKDAFIEQLLGNVKKPHPLNASDYVSRYSQSRPSRYAAAEWVR